MFYVQSSIAKYEIDQSRQASGAYNGAVLQKSCSTQHTLLGTFLLLLAGRTKTD